MRQEHHRILYVEDEPGEVYLLQTLLSEWECPVSFDFVESIAQALVCFNPEKHLLVISDYHLTDGTAPDLARAILEKEKKANIVAVSSVYTPCHLTDIKAAGIMAYWEKGDPNELLEKMMILALSILRSRKEEHVAPPEEILPLL